MLLPSITATFPFFTYILDQDWSQYCLSQNFRNLLKYGGKIALMVPDIHENITVVDALTDFSNATICEPRQREKPLRCVLTF